MVDKTGWRARIIRASNDLPKPLLSIVTTLRCEPRWQGALAFDLFALVIVHRSDVMRRAWR
jgi:hypothetical protein